MNRLTRDFLAFVLIVCFSCQPRQDSFDRHPVSVHYSKHARCRMACRHITEADVMEVLEKGRVNYGKSEMVADACHQKYALEASTTSNHRLRIIFAPCNGKMTVVTCIDLDVEWDCHCN